MPLPDLDRPIRPTPGWHSSPVDTVFQAAGSSAAGLTDETAQERLAEFGPNELQTEEGVWPAQIFAAQFKSLLVWLLIGAAVISLALQEFVDGAGIMIVVVTNAGIGFLQEYHAAKSIDALRRLTAPQSRVRREGRTISVPASELVVGDILVLEAGDIVGADGRLLWAASLECNEATLTGESVPVCKFDEAEVSSNAPVAERSTMVFMGTAVTAGKGEAVVVATGMATELGGIAGLLRGAEDDRKTPLLRELDALSQWLVWMAGIVVVLLLGIGLLHRTKPLDMLLTAVSLAVAAVPEGLPAVVTIALALGVRRMARQAALIRHLPAVETLGCAQVICTDKTGTLTVGEMTAREVYAGGKAYLVWGEGYSPAGRVEALGDDNDSMVLGQLAEVVVGCNHAELRYNDSRWSVLGDSTEGALLALGHKLGCEREELDERAPILREWPFDSDRKRSSVLRAFGTVQKVLVNGAPETLIPLCTHILTPSGVLPFSGADGAEILRQNEKMARKSLRVIASATRTLHFTPTDETSASEVERGLTFIGLTGIHDPPRPEAREAIDRCRSAGIQVVMITGDQPSTAWAIAKELGIANAGGAVVGNELDAMGEADFLKRVNEARVYARVAAAHKLRIVRAWQALGAVVAMTGDGVNDAPAVKGADIGVAMGLSGSEVTKQSADMVVTDDNFASIVAAVQEGRTVFDNIRKTLQYLLAGNSGELILMTATICAGLPAPLLPIHLLWVNLITDGLPAIFLAAEPSHPAVMTRQPRPRIERLANASFVRLMLLTGLLTGSLAMAVFLNGLYFRGLEAARSEAFTVLVFAELLRSLGCRSDSQPVWKIPISTNRPLYVVVGIAVALQFWALEEGLLGRFLQTEPLSWQHGLVLLGLATIPAIVADLMKLWRQRALT